MKRFYLIGLMLALCGLQAVAQTVAPQIEPSPPPTHLAIEIHNGEVRPTYISGRGKVLFGRVARIPHWQPPADFLPVRGLDLSSQVVDETTLRIKLSLQRGERYLDERMPVAVYEVREGQTVMTEELKQFGLLPIKFKVMRIRQKMDAPPHIESPTTALELVGVERLDTLFPSYTVRLRNLSNKDIAAFQAHYFSEKGIHTLMTAQHLRDEPLIKAGEVYEMRAMGGSYGEITADGYTPDGLQRIFIPTVFFTDETFEGERWPAAEMVALKHGRRLQLTRALSLVNNSLRTTYAGGEAAQIASFKTQAAALAEEVDPQTVETLAARFPALSPGEKLKLRGHVNYYLHRVKTNLLQSAREFEAARAGANKSTPTFREWLTTVKENYEQWLARL